MQVYLLPLLDGVDGIWLELKFLRPTKLPVEDDDNEDSKKDRDDHTYDQPDAAALSLSWRDSWTQERNR